MGKINLGYFLILTLIILVPANFFIKEVRAEYSIYIRVDGSIDPLNAPIQQNGETYTLTSDFSTDSDAIVIERSGITLDGADYTLTGTNAQYQKGISLNNVQHVTVKNLEIKSFDIGIMFWNSSYTTITGNRILNNLNQGIGFGGHIGTYYNQHNLIKQNVFSGNNVAMAPVEDGDLINSVITQNQIIANNNGLGIGTEGHSWINITINDNIITDNLGAAIYFVTYKAPTWGITINNNEIRNNGAGIELDLWGVPDTLIFNNIIADNNGFGLKLEGTCNSTISGNLIQGNDGGLKLSHGYGDVSTTKNNIINENTIIMNNQYGIFLNGAPENQINNNIIANNSNGIILTSMFFEGYDILSNNNWITENQIIQNTNHGLQMNQCNDNLIHHNTFVDNLIQVHSEESINIWDNRLNTGNFWNDYSGIDVNHDGIGDTPYVIDENNQDNYPIVPVEIPANVEFDLIVSIAGLGSTSPSVGTYSFENGTEVIVNASPAPGWVFSNWILDSINVGNSNSYTVTMDENHSLSAVFTEIIPQQYALTLSTNGDGNTSPSVGTYTYEEASEVVVTASANSEWTFNHWELENVDVGNSNPYTIVMNTDHSLTAVFLKIPQAENVDEPFKVTTYNVIVETNTYIIETWSNSTLSGLVLNLSANRISFNVEGISGTTGLCNITVPTELFSGQFLIYKNGTLLTKDLDYTESYNITHYLFSFTYEHSTHKIEIIATYAVPEFPFWIILPLFVAVSTTVIFYNKKLR